MTRTKLFCRSRSQALRLQKDVAFPPDVTEIVIIKEGERRVVVPADAVWDDFFASPGIDLPDRAQPAHEKREAF